MDPAAGSVGVRPAIASLTALYARTLPKRPIETSGRQNVHDHEPPPGEEGHRGRENSNWMETFFEELL